MASLMLTSTSFSPFFRTPTPGASKPTKGIRRTVSACKATSDHQKDEQKRSSTGGRFDRRDVLVGLGGLYGVAGLSTTNVASADPVQAPDLNKCHDLRPQTDVNCCPPLPGILDYTPPKRFPCQRVRPAAHDVDGEYIAKFRKAIELMRALPEDDPRSFKQQADVHCAYCCDAYEQIGFPDKRVQVHYGWLFFPFHRWYLYFFERILGSLIDDPTFALPFWNWDHPDGMRMPQIYVEDPESSLYDVNRNPIHLPPVLADLDYKRGDPEDRRPDQEIIDHNRSIMYRQVVSPNTAELFMGKALRAGEQAESAASGALERMPHNNLHNWGGNPANPDYEDLGTFYAAGRDPLFYAHHANIDRMWDIWKTLPGGRRNDFTDPDWLEATFLFYDENKQLVRVKVRDAIDTTRLGYTYKDRPLPWLHARPTPRKSKAVKITSKTDIVPTVTPLTAFPVTLEKAISTEVRRPTEKRRSKEEKDEKTEVLVIQGVDFEKNSAVGFSVYVNDKDQTALIRPNDSEFAGSFTTVPSGIRGNREKTKTDVLLAITELLEDLDAEDDDTVVVTLVPTTGVGKVKIDGIKIELR